MPSATSAPAPPTPVVETSRAPAPSSSSGVVTHGGRHVVQPGDTLWGIAARMLGPGASAASVAHLVERLWALNGANLRTGSPDLIEPGQVLLLP